MSHFLVLVVGSNIDEQLAPFHEFECTGIEEYIEEVDETDLVKIKGLEYYGYDDKVVSSEEEIDIEGKHKYGYAIVKEDVIIKAIKRTNPNSHWDWYEEGGRWPNFFKLKDSDERTFKAMKKEIDFEGMRKEVADDSRADWLKHKELVGDLTWVSWEEARSRFPVIEEARDFYNNQEAILKLNKNFDGFYFNKDCFLKTEEEYVKSKVDLVGVCYSCLKDGLWNSRGEMGWFGMSTDTVEESDWVKMFNKMLDELPDDTLLTAVDCHI